MAGEGGMPGAERSPRARTGIWTPLAAIRRPERGLALVSLGIVAFCCLTYWPFLADHVSRLVRGNRYVALADGLFNPFRNRQVLLGSGLPIYDLKIRPRQYALLQETAERADSIGWLNDDLKTWADAKFLHDGRTYDVKVRLRGDLRPHWTGPKKSYRIKFGKQTITDSHGTRAEPIFFEGKHEINLIIPHDRAYALTPFVNQVMREQGLVVPRDRWVVLRINGVLHGLYYEVEHFDKPLLAAARRPETTIFGQNTRAMHYEHLTRLGRPGPTDAGFDLGSLRRQVEPEGDLGLRAMEVLVDHSLNPTPESFRRVRAVLDWDKYLRYRAMTALLATSHTKWGTDNLKLYFDQSRGLIEPVPWDVHLERMPREPGTIDFYNRNGTDEIQRATLLDPQSRLQRNRYLWQLVGDGGDSLIAKYDAIHSRIRRVVWADVLTTPVGGYKMDGIRKTLIHNIRRAHKVLEYSSANATFRLLAPDRAAVDLACLNYSGIRLTGIEIADSLYVAGRYRLYEDGDHDGELGPDDPLVAETKAEGGTARLPLDAYVFPRVRYDSEFIDGTYWEFFDALVGRRRFFVVGQLAPSERGPLDFRAPRLRVAALNAVTERPIATATIDPRQPAPDNTIGVIAVDASDPWDLEAPEASLSEFLARHPQFQASKTHPGAAELAGTVAVSGAAIVPKSVPLILQPGADITLGPGACVLCYGGLSSIGTAEAPITIHGDSSRKPWNTVAVVRPPGKVVIAHTRFRDGGQAQINGTLFTGSLAVHDGDLDIMHCRFTDMKGEDAVNVKNGRLSMTDCDFRQTSSDALDLDWATGEVTGNRFADIGGDAIDLSGSRVLVAGNRCQSIADKGISVGEDSHPIVVNNLLMGCAIGVSCKDLSHVRAEHCTFVGNQTAIEAKRKKPMFGGGSGAFSLCVFAENRVLLDEDYFSRGKVTVQRSIADVETPWPTCRKEVVEFADPGAGDYRLAPGPLEDAGIRGTRPPGSVEKPDEIPGILSGPAPGAGGASQPLAQGSHRAR